MKLFIAILLLVLGAVYISKNTSILDNTILKRDKSKVDTSVVQILYKLDAKTFPENWLDSEINAKVVELDSAEFVYTKKVMDKTLSKYPKEVIQRYLKRLYLFKEMSFFGSAYGGTYFENTVYVTNEEYKACDIEEIFHHEFSSVLLEKNPSFLDQKAWKSCNTEAYWDESGGVNALNGRSSEEFEARWHEKGFLHEYATTDIENDLNSFAEHMFLGTKEFHEVCEEYPRLKKKYQLAIEFYSKVNTEMDEDFFEGLKNK